MDRRSAPPIYPGTLDPFRAAVTAEPITTFQHGSSPTALPAWTDRQIQCLSVLLIHSTSLCTSWQNDNMSHPTEIYQKPTGQEN